MDIVFPEFVRASDCTAPPPPPQKSLWQLVIETAPNEPLPQREAPRRVLPIQSGPDDRSSRGSSLDHFNPYSHADGDGAGDATRGPLHSRTSWSLAPYLARLSLTDFPRRYAQLHGIACSLRHPPPPCLRVADVQLPEPLSSRLMKTLAEPSRRPNVEELRAIVLGHASCGSHPDAADSAHCLGKRNGVRGGGLRALQQMALPAMFMGHHTLTIGPRGAGGHMAGYLATAALTLAMQVEEENEEKDDYNETEKKEETTDPKQGRDSGVEEDVAKRESTFHATRQKEGTDTWRPRAVMLLSDDGEVRRCARWLRDVFTVDAFALLTLRRGSAELIPLFPKEPTTANIPQEITSLLPLPPPHIPPLQENKEKEESEEKEEKKKGETLSRPGHKRSREVSPHEETNENDNERHRRHRHRRHSRSRSRSRKSNDSRVAKRRRHSKSVSRSGRRHHHYHHRRSESRRRRHHHRRHHSREGKRHRSASRSRRGDRTRRDRYDPHEGDRPHRNRHRSDEDRRRRQKDNEETSRPGNDTPVCTSHARADSPPRIAQEQPQQQQQQEGYPHPQPPQQEERVQQEHCVHVCEDAQARLPLAYHQRRIPILLVSHESFVDAIQSVGGQPATLPLECVRMLFLGDADRLASSSSRVAAPTTWWTALAAAVDVDCQCIAAATRMQSEVVHWLRSTFLDQCGAPGPLVWYKQRDDASWEGVQHFVEAVPDEAARRARLAHILTRSLGHGHSSTPTPRRDRGGNPADREEWRRPGVEDPNRTAKPQRAAPSTCAKDDETMEDVVLGDVSGPVAVVCGSRRAQEVLMPELASFLCTTRLTDFRRGEASLLLTHDGVVASGPAIGHAALLVNYDFPRPLLAPGREEDLADCIAARARALFGNAETNGGTAITLLTERQMAGRIGRLLEERAQATPAAWS